MSDPDIELDVELEAAPETVRRALTDPAIVSQWLGPLDPAIQPANPADGEDGAVTYRWRDRANAAPAVDNEVVFEVTPRSDGGSRLRIAHTITPAWATNACNDNQAKKSLKWAA